MKNKQRIQRNIPPAIAAHRVSCCVAAALILIWCVLLIIPPTRSFAVQLLGICGFYGVCIGMLRLTSLWSAIRSLRAKSVAAIAAASITAAVFYAWYFSLYHYYPTWDRINYWSMTIRFNAETSTSLVHTIKDVYWSINNSDYNDLLSWVAALPTRLAPQWTATFFVLTILFLLPASFIITMFVYMHAAASTQRQTMVLVTIYAGILCLSAFIRPVLIGYDDVVVLLLFVIVLAGVFDSHMLHSVPLRIMLGIGLAGTFLLRRWFIYACLGLAVTAIIYWGCRIALTVANNRRDLFSTLVRTMLTIGATTLVCLVSFPGFLRKSLFGNQSVAYHAWTIFTSYQAKFINIGQTIGWLWLAIAIAGLAITAFIGFRHHESHLLQLSSLQGAMLVGAAVGALLFWQIQDFSPQHWYIVCVFIIVSYCLPLVSWLNAIQGTVASRVASASVVLVSLIGLCHGIGAFTFPEPVNRALSYITGTTITTPTKSNDLTEKRQLVSYLRQQTKGRRLVYFAAASDNLNSTLPLSTCLPECTVSPFPVANADVDSYSGFNMQFFDAQYVVVSRPVSLHMNPDNEQLVTTLNETVQDSSSVVGKHYTKMKSFTLDHGVTAIVYARTAEYSRTDIQQVAKIIGNLDSPSRSLFRQQFREYLASQEH